MSGHEWGTAPEFVGPRHELRERLLLDLFLSASPGPEVLEHVEDDRGALAEVARVLRPGGVVAVSVPANPRLQGPSDEWAGHVRRYTRPALIDACTGAGLTVDRCVGWGFPFSRLYHRHVYERYLDRHGPSRPGGRNRHLVAAVGALLQVDRLFVGVERGALGYLLLATRP